MRNLYRLARRWRNCTSRIATVGWRMVATGRDYNNLQFCRTGPATIGRRMNATSRSKSGRRAKAVQVYSPQPYSNKPVIYRPYGLDR